MSLVAEMRSSCLVQVESYDLVNPQHQKQKCVKSLSAVSKTPEGARGMAIRGGEPLNADHKK